ncbi:hypothetical protein NDU88_010197 [Pleurodeles waltl]|uniref:Uncharacterized protein n=1 Tax=Pleurodeles waltl TaxID=8319 RepID=A0AAV7PUZ7_PLEWA|nr:hypothetical protein NDU88_010197 [Pleurodeles waltl]
MPTGRPQPDLGPRPPLRLCCLVAQRGGDPPGPPAPVGSSGTFGAAGRPKRGPLPHLGCPLLSRGGSQLHPRPRLQARGGAACLLPRQPGPTRSSTPPRSTAGARQRRGPVLGTAPTLRRGAARTGSFLKEFFHLPLRSDGIRRAP